MIMPWEEIEIEKNCENCAHGVDMPGEYCCSCRIPGNWNQNWEPVELDLNAVDYSAKADTGKPRCDLVSPALIEAVGYVRGYGTDKYGDPDNWQSVESSRFMAALIRHLCHCMRDLNSVDEESGLPHLWHVATNVNFLMERVEVK